MNIKKRAASIAAAAAMGLGAVGMATPAQAEPVFTESLSSHDAPTCAHMTQGKVWQLESKGYAVTVMKKCEASVEGWFQITYNSTIHYRKMYH